MKNVLLISQSFAPRNAIAAIRFTKVVKYLARTGEYHFWIICVGVNENDIKDELLQRDIEEVKEHVTIFSISIEKKFLKKIKSIFARRGAKETKEIQIISKKEVISSSKRDMYYIIQKDFLSCKKKGIIGKTKKEIGKIILAVNDIYDLMFEVVFARRGIEILKKIPIENVDVLISTYGNVGSLLLALKIKDVKKEIKWIVDYRDPVHAASSIKKKYLKRIVAAADEKADYIIGVTNSCIGSGQHLDKFEVITNGFDKDDIKGFSAARRAGKLQITYTGSLYGGKRDMSLLFKIISELEVEGILERNCVSIAYAGKHFHILQEQAKAYNLESILINEGFLSRKKALKLQFQSDILCALSWNSENQEGILTGKFIEYFMMGKNIFSIVTGNKSNSIIKQITDKARLGYCLEQAGDSAQYIEAKQWFLSKYTEFMQNGYIASYVNESITEEYSSANMADKFRRIIDRC